MVLGSDYSVNRPSWSNSKITKMYNKEELDVRTAIQRGEVWTIQQKSLLIDSLIRGIVVPEITLIQMEGKTKYEVIDGKQRITSIAGYYNGDYSLWKGINEVIGSDGDTYVIAGLKYNDLPDPVKAKLDAVKLSVIAYEDIKTNEEKSEIFRRMNNGTPLSSSEKNISRSKSQGAIDALSDHPVFEVAMSKTSLLKLSQRNWIIKSYISIMEEDPLLDARQIGIFLANTDINESSTSELTDIYTRMLDMYDVIKDEEEDKKRADGIASRFLKRATHFIAVVTFLHHHNEDVTEFIRHFYRGEKASISEKYNSVIDRGVWKKDAINARNEALEEEYKKFTQG